MTIGEKIRALRKSKGLTQKELGEMCGINEANIRKYEAGKQNPKFETLEKISSSLGVHVFALLSSDNESNSYKELHEIYDEGNPTELGRALTSYFDSLSILEYKKLEKKFAERETKCKEILKTIDKILDKATTREIYLLQDLLDCYDILNDEYREQAVIEMEHLCSKYTSEYEKNNTEFKPKM